VSYSLYVRPCAAVKLQWSRCGRVRLECGSVRGRSLGAEGRIAESCVQVPSIVRSPYVALHVAGTVTLFDRRRCSSDDSCRLIFHLFLPVSVAGRVSRTPPPLPAPPPLRRTALLLVRCLTQRLRYPIVFGIALASPSGMETALSQSYGRGFALNS